jgi:hypothetical protein
MSRGIKRKRVILIPKSSFELDASPKFLQCLIDSNTRVRYIIPDWDCTYDKNKNKRKRVMLIPQCTLELDASPRVAHNV